MRMLVVPAGVCLVVLLAARPALAADDPLGLSPDGVRWSAALPAPLFPSDLRWVPGDALSSTFYVRNQAEDGATLSILAGSPDADRVIAAGDLAVSAQIDDGASRLLLDDGGAYLLDGAALAAGGIRRITITVAFAPAASNDTQAASTALALQVTLAETAGQPPSPGVGSSAQGSGGPLAVTGADARRDILLAAALIGAGWAMLAGRRRDRGNADG